MDEFNINDTETAEDFSQKDTSGETLFTDLPADLVFDGESVETKDVDPVISDLPQYNDQGNASDIQEISDWIGDINPHFDPFDVESPYSTNCGSCAYAVYQRLEGIDDACATEDNIDYNFQMNGSHGLGTSIYESRRN